MSANKESMEHYILERYKNAIDYYWKASRNNKRAYKLTRSLTVILGELVTLIASLSSANFINSIRLLDTLFAIAAPVLAAVLTIVAGFAQTFHWGAARKDMVLNAQRLEKERDQFNVAKPEERDFAKELEVLNDLVITETQNFFQRILGSGKKNEYQSENNNDEHT